MRRTYRTNILFRKVRGHSPAWQSVPHFLVACNERVGRVSERLPRIPAAELEQAGLGGAELCCLL